MIEILEDSNAILSKENFLKLEFLVDQKVKKENRNFSIFDILFWL